MLLLPFIVDYIFQGKKFGSFFSFQGKIFGIFFSLKGKFLYLNEKEPSLIFDAYQVLGFGHNCLTFFPLNFEPVSENSPREDCLLTLELFATEAP